MEIHIYAGWSRIETPMESQFSMHIHNDSQELLYFISGNASYYVEGRRYPLAPGDLMLMRKGEAHNLLIGENAPYERIVVNFDIPELPLLDPQERLLSAFQDRSLGKYNHYPAALFPGNHWHLYLQQICDSPSQEQKLCYLLPLLSDLANSFEILKAADHRGAKDRSAAIVKYINRHLQEELSLEQLAQQFYVSKTHLNRIFKQSTGTTVWHYITVKRLFLARKLLSEGLSPTRVSLQCGFLDYSTFYRAYRQHFGESPKNRPVHLDPLQEIPGSTF